MENLYLFTDGGLFDLKMKTQRMSSSFVLANKTEVIAESTSINMGGTTPRAEYIAFRNGVKELCKYIEDIPGEYKIELIVDSILVFSTFNDWVFNWIKKAGGVDKEWISTSKKPVANQDVLRDALKLLFKIKEKRPFKLMHINSHITRANYEESYLHFNEINKINVTREEFNWYLCMNDICDKNVGKYGRDKSLIPE